MVLVGSLLIGSAAWSIEPQPEPVPNAPQKEEGVAPGTEEGVMDPKADAALRQMSDYLAGLKRMRVDTVSVDEKVTRDGHKVQEVQASRVAVERPGDLRVDRLSAAGHVTFLYDGKQFSIYNRDRNVYATAPAPPRLDAAIDQARDRLHIDAPGGDLLVNDVYGSLTDGTVEGRYIGLEPIDGVMAHHIAVTKKDVDWQIWIKDGEQAVPLRYVITSTDLPGKPEFTLELRNWQPNAVLVPHNFSFSPPVGAKRVNFAPPAAGGSEGRVR
jgi:hypothetical protein